MTTYELKDYLVNLTSIFKTMLERETDNNQIQYVKGEQALANQLIKKIDAENSEKLISISLPIEIWEQIASACISVADYGIINDQIKNDLRKTYFQIKAETR